MQWDPSGSVLAYADGAPTAEFAQIVDSPTSTPSPTPTSTPHPLIYRAIQVGARVHIERAMSAGIDPFDSPPEGDGWTLIGRTNGAGDNGTLMAFAVIDDVPYAAIQHASKGCIVVTPTSLEPRRQGQTRMVRIVEQGVSARCAGDWTGSTP